MIVCRLEAVSRHYATETIFTDVSCQIGLGDRIGLVGPNGAGKTTLLRVLAGEDPPDTGKVHWMGEASIAYLRQHRDVTPGNTLLQEVRSGMAHLERWYEEMVQAGHQMAEVSDPDEHRRAAKVYDDRQELLHRHGGFDFEHRVEEVLFGLGFREDQFEQDIATMSGGQQSRALLARMLLNSPDLLLMDEPTNHLDIAGTEWLEAYLVRQQMAMVIVSHDRMFLDKTVTKIFEILGGRLSEYPGNYSTYAALRGERQMVLERERTKQSEEIARLEEFVRRNKAGQLSKQAKSREKQIERLKEATIDRIADVHGPAMTFTTGPRTGDIVLSARGLSKSFEEPLFSDVDIEIERGWRIGVIGPNGAGKTTLVRILLGEEPPTSGTARLGHNVRVGFLRQEVDDIDPNETCLEAVRPPSRGHEKAEVFRALLARFGLGEDLADNRVRSLSGGQRSRLALARISARDVNLLVLDEPTNHLDLWACRSLEEALESFDGTVLVVSHDRSFLNAVCQRLLILEYRKVRMITGNYDRYVEIRDAAKRRDAAPAKKESTPPPAAAAVKRKRKFPFRRSDEIEADISRLEARLAELADSVQSPDVYSDARKLDEATREMDLTRMELDQLLEHWAEAVEMNS